MMNLAFIVSLFALRSDFLCHKILRHGASGLTSPPKEGVLQIFSALKNPLPQLGLNLQTLGPMTSMLTTGATCSTDGRDKKDKLLFINLKGRL
jgi:hypothetical protein